MEKILRIGVPIALQDGLIQVAFIVITIIANQRGLNDAAAVGIVEKVISFLFLIPSSMLSTVSALGAQNIGAGKPERAIRTLRYAVLLAVSFGVLASITIQFTAEQIVALFTDRSTAAGAQVRPARRAISAAATSLTAFSRAFISASAATSAPAANPGCRFCTTFSPSCWCVSPAFI